MAVQSYMGLIAALAGSMGPLFGGWLAENFSWRWCFCTFHVQRYALVLFRRTEGEGEKRHEGKTKELGSVS